MRPWLVWISFTLCLLVVLGVLGWVCVTALDLDSAETEARRKADFEEGVRLALWRMESALTPLITQESSRPYFTYSAFYPPERAYTRMFEELDTQDVLVPSPLLKLDIQEIVIHFQIDPLGNWTSPQLPLNNMRDIAESRGFSTGDNIDRAARRLAALRARIVPDELAAALPAPDPTPGVAPVKLEGLDVDPTLNVFPVPNPAPRIESGKPGNRQQGRSRRPRGNYKQQPQRNDVEWQARIEMGCSSEINRAVQGLQPRFLEDVLQGPMLPLWRDDQLLMARRVVVKGQQYIQGCLLDWTHIKTGLLATSTDLLPAADLVPMQSPIADQDRRCLAVLPVRLIPGPVSEEDFGSEVRFSIIVAWGCVLMAAVAVALLLVGATSMSERRRRFVSAVTHELRTPLTTFRMYTEMLNEGMVKSPDKQREYLSKLNVEADRLGHLVENVLAYARLEGGSGSQCVESVPLTEVIERVRGRLAERAEQAGLELRIESTDSPLVVAADVGAVERILFNLVDNACKYAHSGEPSAVELQACQSGDTVRIEVRDHGPGVPRDRRALLFRPFSRAGGTPSHEPGVGLGLALSRRLARQMGGDLWLDESYGGGAGFVLVLPAG